MATLSMKKMNKSQKRKLKRLAMRQKWFEDNCKKIQGYREANTKPGAVK